MAITHGLPEAVLYNIPKSPLRVAQSHIIECLIIFKAGVSFCYPLSSQMITEKIDRT